ncbi:MAG: DHCW motif cupin fold protein [Methanospirillum sp.]|uniref:DHCW motif cupin fold protein n=1 Tax=Methanospirillum sp. TaxID=45200 RepID=UPI00236B0E03|nr:DHCW motif cupin fold protein [Methanospirillum sp.]MDD1729319.1 DHCW motif cupin fold protein [Methanospirillum sp.]
MNTLGIPYQVIDWALISKTEHAGEKGLAFWQTLQLPGLRIRLVEYSAGYIADHWCKKGHIVHCLEGEFVSELQDGQKSIIKKGMTYVVSDELSLHRSSTKKGVKLLIIDGDFLQLKDKNQ